MLEVPHCGSGLAAGQAVPDRPPLWLGSTTACRLPVASILIRRGWDPVVGSSGIRWKRRLPPAR